MSVEAFLEPEETISTGLWGGYNHLNQDFCPGQMPTVYKKYLNAKWVAAIPKVEVFLTE